MSTRRVIFAVEFLSRDGVRLEREGDEWRVINIRQLGEKQRLAALALLERAEAAIVRKDGVPLPTAEFVPDCERVAVKLGLRITHRRVKKMER